MRSTARLPLLLVMSMPLFVLVSCTGSIENGVLVDSGASEVSTAEASFADDLSSDTMLPSGEGGAPPADALPDSRAAHDSTPSNSRLLDTSVVSQIVEPVGSGTDDAGNSYTDKNYWNFCMPGAVTAALYYEKSTNVTAWPAAYFKEPKNAPSTIPSAGTYWKSDESVNGYHTYGRAYLMYLAMEVKPPSYVAAGICTFSSYPTTGATLVDARDALNWEGSGHASSWSSYHYRIVYSSGLTATNLHASIKTNIDSGRAVVVAADTAYLPNWSRSLMHAVTVIGYNDSASTYTFVDTCGVKCNGSSKSKNGGTWTISQSTLLTAITSSGGGYVW